MGSSAPAIAALLVAVQVQSAAAVDWSLKALFSESATADDNRALSTTALGATYGVTAGVAVDLGGKTPLSSFDLSTNFNYPYHFGPGAAGLSNGLSPIGATASFATKTRLNSYTFSASIVPESAATSELTDSGLVGINATRLTTGFAAGVSHQIDALDTLALSTAATTVRFTGNPGLLKPYTGLSVSGTWDRKLTRRTDFNAVLAVARFDPEGGLPETTYSATTGFSTTPTRLLSLAASFGARATETAGLASTAGLLGSLSLSYKLKSTAISLTASQTAAPSSLGVIQNATSLGFSLDHTINDAAHASVAVTYGAYSSAAAARQVLVIAPTYSYQLTKNMQAQFSYSFTQQLGGTGAARSNAVFATLTHSLQSRH